MVEECSEACMTAVFSLVAAGIVASGILAAATTTAPATRAVPLGPTSFLAKLHGKVMNLWEIYGEIWTTIFTSIYIFFVTSFLGGDRCFVVINDSPKHVELIVNEEEMVIKEQQLVEYEITPPKIAPCFNFKNTFTKDVGRAGSKTQRIPLPTGVQRKILVQGPYCYLTVRSFTKSFDPGSYSSSYGCEFGDKKGMRGYIVHDSCRLAQRTTRLADVANLIRDFIPEEHAKLDDTTHADDDKQQENATPQPVVPGLELFKDPQTDLESPPNSRSIAWGGEDSMMSVNL